MNPPVPRPEIQEYITALNTKYALVNLSAGVLLDLWRTYGELQVDVWLREYFDELRAYDNYVRLSGGQHD